MFHLLYYFDIIRGLWPMHWSKSRILPSQVGVKLILNIFFFSRRFISIMDPWSDCAVYSVNIVRHAATITQSTMWHPDCDCCVQPQSDYEWITLKEFTEKGTHLHTWEQTHLCSSRQKVTLLFHTKEWEIWLNNIIASIWNEWMNIIAFDSNENYTHKCECMLSVQKASLSCFAP